MANPTVSVVIPARNEQENIGLLLKQITRQNLGVYNLVEILVYSDGSTDATVDTSKAINNAKIRTLVGTEAKGKTARLQELFAVAKGDIIVQFDADVRLGSDTVIIDLVTCIVYNEAQLVSASLHPTEPRAFFERVAYFGWDAWQAALKEMHPEPLLHRSIGSARAFRKDFFTNFSFPKDIASAEDVYCYLFAVERGMKVTYAKEAVVHYRLPTVCRDYMQQMKRFMHNGTILKKYFDKEFIDREATVSLRAKIVGLTRTFFRYNPVVSTTYILIQLYIHFFGKNYINKVAWDLSKSTKKFD